MRIVPCLGFVFAAAVVFSVSTPAHAMTESFTGETKLVKALDPEERLAYFGTQYLMNRYQRRAYLSLPTARERADWFERFWIDHDPTPATSENERKEELDRRVALARKLFGMKKAPGWDKRGETLIRYGVPTNRTQTMGEVGFYDATPPGEVWYYQSFDMIVQFSNFNLKGEYFFTNDPVGRSSRRELDRNQNISALMKYGVMQEYYLTEYMTPDELKDIVDFNPDDIDYVADPSTRMLALKDRIAEIEKEKLQKQVNNFYTYLDERPIVFSFEVNQRPLPLYFDVTSFRGGERTLRAEVNVEVPSSELTFVRKGGASTAEVEIRVLVRDMNDHEIAAGVDTVRPTMTGDKFKGPALVPGQVILALAPGYYRLGIEARDLVSKRHAGYRTNVELAPYVASPAISDIQFASSIAETDENRRFLKGNLQVIPHPIHAYRLPFPVSLYFEIYGLDTDREGLAYYRVEYKIVPLEKRRKGPVLVDVPSIVSSSFETSGYGSTQPQHISVEPINLWEGPFRFIVTVTDRRTFRTATRSEDFSILK
jgi:GWxTD domain-containing protein